jgi:hypothetical protein
LLGLRRLPPERFVSSFDQLVALLIVNLLVWAGLDSLHAESGSQLMLDGLYGWAFYLLLGLFACGLVARAHSALADTRALLIPVLSVSPYVLIAFWVSSDLVEMGDRPLLWSCAAALYLCVLAIRALQAAYFTVRAQAVVLAVVFVAAAPFIFRGLDLDTRLWLADDTDDEQTDDASAAESLLYDQPARIVAAIEHLAPRLPDKANVFYVGVAGDGEQAIFKREALFAEQVLAEHFGSADRSIELINDNGDRDSYPIASVSGIQQALKLVASRMDTREDVLVLMLTSHGSQDGLAIVNGTVPLLQLSPGELRHALDESGIKWRIVIVSACYSGVFVDALKGSDTLVVTAADAQHSSFGCDDDRELTYFGEALLKDSLPGAKSLEAAFQKAQGIIRRRETSEHKTPSNPQISVGASIHDKLAGLEGGAQPSEHSTIVER